MIRFIRSLSPLLALTTTIGAAAPQYPVIEVVAFPSDTPGIIGTVTLDGLLDSDASGAWVSGVVLAQGQLNRQSIFGVVPELGVTQPGLVRVPQTIGGDVQVDIFAPRLRAGSLAYLARLSTGRNSAWVDDQVVARFGESIGASGLVWGDVSEVHFGLPGEFYVTGSASTGGPLSPEINVVVHYPSETLLLASGDSVRGLNGAPMLVGRIEVSPSGAHWAAVVGFDAGGPGPIGSALIVDGVLHRFRNGTPAISGGNVAIPVGPGQPGVWTQFRTVFVTDDLDVTFEANTTNLHLIVRNETAVVLEPVNSFTSLLDVDAAGRALSRRVVGSELGLQVDGVDLGRPGVAGIDANGDGQVNAGWSYPSLGSVATAAGFTSAGRVLAQTSVLDPTGQGRLAIVEAKMALPIYLVCEGVPNQTGVAAGLRWIGTDRPAFNDLSLAAIELPVGTIALPIFSRTTASVPMAGGGIGTLCLGGSIGRGFPVNIVTFASTDIEVPVFTNAIPQPTGSVAALAGDTWHAQVWYRDVASGVATSNFSDAVSVTFQ